MRIFYFYIWATLLLCLCLKATAQNLGNHIYTGKNDFGVPEWNCGHVLLLDSITEAEIERVRRTIAPNVPFLKVHGNIYYDFYYRSNIDTPYTFKDYEQHTVRTYLDVVMKDKYPLRVNLTARINNAPSGFLKNMAGANFQFNSQQFADSIRNKALRWLKNQELQQRKLQLLANEIKKKYQQMDSLRRIIHNPSREQNLIEEQERKWLSAKTGSSRRSPVQDNIRDSAIQDLASSLRLDSLKNKDFSKFGKTDSVATSVENKYRSALVKYDSIKVKLDELEKRYNKLYQEVSAYKKTDANSIKSANSPAKLLAQIDDSGMPDSLLPAGYKKLLAIKSFGIGRTVVDYSELSAKNITINGFQTEYNPGNYYAVAIGTIDYRYRDLILPNRDKQSQYLTIARFGKGTIGGNNIIFTYYSGKKQIYNYATRSNDTLHYPDYHLSGFTAEMHYKLNKSTLVTAELAKSASPYYNRTIENKSIIRSNLALGDRSNEAYLLKINTSVPQWGTKLAASYKKIGSNFQSFSLFNSSSQQSIWSARIEQPFFKKQLNIIASVRTNDCQSPYIDNNYYSNTVFKSLQATLRVKKLPVLSLGYCPSSQLVKTGDDKYMENLFYMMTAYVSHFYTFHHVNMSTFLSYTRFYNRQADTGFIYFNTKNLLVNHTLFFKNFSLSSEGAVASSNEYSLYTLGSDLQMSVSKYLSVRGGMKYNYQTTYNNRQVGYTIGSTIRIPYLGEIQLFAEKGFIPGINRQLVSNNTGRISYFKSF